MPQSLDLMGYGFVKIFARTQKKRRMQKGRARGFYEGKYIYVRVRLPDGTKRDLYLGRPGEPGARRKKRGGEKPRELAPATSSRKGWRNRVEKANRADTRDEYDPRQREMFGGARRR